MKQHTQLCWDCQNARADCCCWMADMVPVQGWDAEWCEAAVLKSGHVRPATYAIKKCPNFVPDKNIEKVQLGRPGNCNARIAQLFKSMEKLQDRQIKFQLKKGVKKHG